MSDELVLAISGNDIFSGGGLHADLATFTTNKQNGFVAITCLTAMTENGFEVIPIDSKVFKQQLDSLKDVPFSAIKIGLLPNVEIAELTLDFVKKCPEIPIVLDPVLVCKETHDVEVSQLRDELVKFFPYVTVITPNLPEVELLIDKKKKTTKPSGTLQQQAQSMFTGDAEQIADDVRDLLNAPENSNVDTLGNLLYRHNRQDLAEATDLYDAIGQQKDIDTIRSLAREWYPQAMQAGIEARRDDLSSGLDNTAREVATIERDDLSGTQGCGDLKAAYETAKRLVDSKSDDYDALTKAQQNLTTAMSGCATNLGPTNREKVFGRPQGTLKEDKE